MTSGRSRAAAARAGRAVAPVGARDGADDYGFGPLPGLAPPDGSFTARAGYGLGLMAPFTEVGWAAHRSRRLRVGGRVWKRPKRLKWS